MIAFELFWRPIYRYGIFYLISFLVWYGFLYWLPRGRFFDQERQKRFPRLHKLLLHKLDDIFLIIILWVIVGGRLGHVLFYERSYYSQHLLEIVQINQWGMSFVWGICGVVLWLLYLVRKHSLTREELFLFGDMVLLIVPVGSLLGRYGNYLNQELIGKEITKIPENIASILQSLWLTTVYDQRDSLERINANFVQSLWEWALLLIFWWSIFLTLYRKNIRPGLIAGVYMIGYALVRFGAEFLKDLPEHEMAWALSVSQRLTIVLVMFGVWVLFLRKNNLQLVIKPKV